MTPRTAPCQVSPSFAISLSLLKLMSRVSDSIQSSHRPLPALLPSIFFSIGVLSKVLVLCISWPKYWSFNFSINPSNEYSGLISFRIDWFDLHAVQETLKSLLQYHNLKALIISPSAFFMVQLSHPYMTTGKITALIIQTFFWQSNVSDF